MTSTTPRVMAFEPVRFETDADLRRLASCRRDRVRFVEIPTHRYLAIDGTEPPGGPAYMAAVGALYSVAYPLHFALRARGVRGHRVGMLEGLYWLPPASRRSPAATDAEEAPPRSWRLIVAIPDEATEDEVDAAIARGAADSSHMYLDRWAEGPCAQILHVGRYDAERRTLERLFAAIEARGLRPHGPHHEIYLNDPHAVGEERAKTVLRQPVTT
jgi:hypothetical protein